MCVKDIASFSHERHLPEVVEQQDREAVMAEQEPTLQQSQVSLVAIASQSQAGKVRAIVERIDAIAAMDREHIQGVADMLKAAKADGGCGIGCW